MTWTQLFPFVSTKEKGPEKGNVITFSLRMPCKQLLCSARGASDDSHPPRNHREWYKETFNFAYNLENGFSEQTLLIFFRLAALEGKVIHGKLWAGAGAMTRQSKHGRRVTDSCKYCARVKLHSPRHMLWKWIRFLVVFFSGCCWCCMIKSETKEAQHDATSATITKF